MKSVVQAIPSYTTRLFKFPKEVLHELNRILANFWWDSSRKGRKVHQQKWEILCKPKWRRGQGFRDFEIFNQAMLAKQAWRILQNPHSLVARVLKAKYYFRENFLKRKLEHQPSYIWKSLLWGKELLLKGLVRRIRDSRKVKIYHDNWLLRPTLFKPFSPITLSTSATVNSLINPSDTQNDPIIDSHFLPQDAHIIKSIPLPTNKIPDAPYWLHDQKGQFSVKSAYYLGLDHKQNDLPSPSTDYAKWWTILWKLQIPNKVKVFLWRLSTNSISTFTGLLHNNLIAVDLCPRCRNRQETIEHAIFEFKSTNECWRKTDFTEIIKNQKHKHTLEIFASLISFLKKEDLEIIGMLAWAIWSSRNKQVMEKNMENPEETVRRAFKCYNEYKEPQDHINRWREMRSIPGKHLQRISTR